MKEKVINLAKEAKLLPPPKDTCQVCATHHPPHYPHNADSLYYQYSFYQEHDRWPTWSDAMAHCSPEVRAFLVEQLKQRGVEVC